MKHKAIQSTSKICCRRVDSELSNTLAKASLSIAHRTHKAHKAHEAHQGSGPKCINAATYLAGLDMTGYDFIALQYFTLSCKSATRFLDFGGLVFQAIPNNKNTWLWPCVVLSAMLEPLQTQTVWQFGLWEHLVSLAPVPLAHLKKSCCKLSSPECPCDHPGLGKSSATGQNFKLGRIPSV